MSPREGLTRGFGIKENQASEHTEKSYRKVWNLFVVDEKRLGFRVLFFRLGFRVPDFEIGFRV